MDSHETPSGVKESADGTRYIGGSVRADGSVRRTFKVRPGYTPPEDVPKYIPRAKRIQVSQKTEPLPVNPVASQKAETKTSTELRSDEKTHSPERNPELPSKTLEKSTKPVGSESEIEQVENLFDKLEIKDDISKKEMPLESTTGSYIPPWKRKNTKANDKPK